MTDTITKFDGNLGDEEVDIVTPIGTTNIGDTSEEIVIANKVNKYSETRRNNIHLHKLI